VKCGGEELVYAPTVHIPSSFRDSAQFARRHPSGSSVSPDMRMPLTLINTAASSKRNRTLSGVSVDVEPLNGL
jgi:hypothetical protein